MALVALLAVFCPVEHDTPLPNPGKGWALIDHATPHEIDAARSVEDAADGTAFEWYQNVAVLSTWALVEPGRGVFDWSLMDKAIDAWADHGKAIHLRFSTEDFGRMHGCPRWLFDMGVPYQVRHFATAELRFPDYGHPVYRRELARFLGVFADRYADDPRIATVNLQGYGNFGEWHSGYGYPTEKARVQALRGIIDIWRQAFAGRKPLNLSASYEWRSMYNVREHLLPWGTSIYDEMPPSYADYRHRSAFDYAYVLPDIALARHGVGGAVFQEYDGRLIANFFHLWRKPMFMEFFGGPRNYRGPSYTGFTSTQEGDDHVPNALDELLSHHPTYASPMGWGPFGGATEFYNEDRDLVLAGHRLMGYRFVATCVAVPGQVRPGARMHVRHSWENRAMGRCHEQYHLGVYLVRDGELAWHGVDETFDTRNLVSGRTYDFESVFDLPEGLAAGPYDLRIALTDATGAPALRLAIEGDDGEQRYAAGRVEVNADAYGTAALPQAELAGGPSRWVAREELMADVDALVSFWYEVTGDPATDLHEQEPGYFRFFAEGADLARVNEFRWFDKAGQPSAPLTVLVSTGSEGPYRLVWEAVGGGSFRVNGVRVEHLDPEAVRRLSVADLDLAEGAQVEQGVRVAFTRDRSQVTLPDDWQPYLRTNPERVPLLPDTVYSVWFNAVARPQIWQGDYHYLHVREAGDEAPPSHPAFRWTHRHTDKPVTRTYTFRTGPGEGAVLEWGIKNGGAARISEVRIVRRSPSQ